MKKGLVFTGGGERMALWNKEATGTKARGPLVVQADSSR